jgi:hypothetical protein
MSRKAQEVARKKYFRQEFGFTPVVGTSPIAAAQRVLERQLVALHLSQLWLALERAEQETRCRNAPSWLKNLQERPMTDAQVLEYITELRVRYMDADNLAKAFNLHPETPLKDE